MSRLEFPRKVKREALERAGGRCEGCGAALKPREAEVDHILECALGGEPVLANAQVLCRQCHKGKTAARVKEIRKADRARDKSTGAMKSKRPLKSRNTFPQAKAKGEKLPVPGPRNLFQEQR